jgi:hypothetical protein
MKKLFQQVFKHESAVSVFLIFLVTWITHGSRIATLGYYYDDWCLLWTGVSRGAESIIPFFSADRPYMGVVYSLVYRLLGNSIANWQWYALLWRFLGALAFYWILRCVWPQNKYWMTIITVLFVVYPGFLSQPDANTKQNHLFGFASALFSIALMLQALKSRTTVEKIVFSSLSILLTANYLFIYEYMIGFEGTRLLLLGYALFQDGIREPRILAKNIFKRWWPYVVVTAGFLYWRFFIFTSTRKATDAGQLAENYLSNLSHMSIRLVIETAKDILDTTILAWFVNFYRLITDAEYADLGAAVLMTGCVLIVVWLYSRWWGRNTEHDTPRPQDLIWLGVIITFFAVFPVVLSDRGLELNDTYKSYGLHPISGVVLFVGGILLCFRHEFRRGALVILLFLSIVTQGLNTSYWAQLWNVEREAWWQLSWRAPDIQNDTLVMLSLPEGYQLRQDYEIWGPVNLIYRPEPAPNPMIQAEILDTNTSYDIFRHRVRESEFRDIQVHRDFNNLLLISQPTVNSCLHVLDGSLPIYSEHESLLVKQVGAYSHIDRIEANAEAHVPPETIFGKEPALHWCYYYQKASLARQRGDWEGISKLYDEVTKEHLSPYDQSEWFPFFEGLVNTGRQTDARQVYKRAFKSHEQLRLPICKSLEKDPDYPADFHYDYPSIHAILCE